MQFLEDNALQDWTVAWLKCYILQSWYSVTSAHRFSSMVVRFNNLLNESIFHLETLQAFEQFGQKCKKRTFGLQQLIKGNGGVCVKALHINHRGHTGIQ